MKFLAFWMSVICLAVWGSVAGMKYVNEYQAAELVRFDCHKTGATATTWDVVPIVYTSFTSYVPVKTDNYEYLCNKTGQKIWRVK